jgi:hypothetical protein
VSLLWRDHYIAVLCPDRVAVVRRRRGRKRPIELLASETCTAPTAQAAVQALAGLLARPEVRKGDLTVVVSSHFVRYLLVPWRAEVRNPAELAAFAAICCDEVFGNEPAGRAVLVSREKASGPRVAAALEPAFLSALRSVAAASPLRLSSIQPYLAAAFNSVRASLDRPDFVFVVAEPKRSCLLVSKEGYWSSLRSSFAADRPQALADLIEREAQLIGLTEEAMPSIFVHAPGQARLDLPAFHGVMPQSISVRVPDALGSAADPLLSMAMTVA